MTRLEAIKSLIEPADAIADVGCDHGLIAEYCAKSGMAKNVIASDISEIGRASCRERVWR